MKIKKSNLPQGEKTSKISETKQAKVESVRKIINASQFDKWHAQFSKAEAKRLNNSQKNKES